MNLVEETVQTVCSFTFFMSRGSMRVFPNVEAIAPEATGPP